MVLTLPPINPDDPDSIDSWIETLRTSLREMNEQMEAIGRELDLPSGDNLPDAESLSPAARTLLKRLEEEEKALIQRVQEERDLRQRAPSEFARPRGTGPRTRSSAYSSI